MSLTPQRIDVSGEPTDNELAIKVVQGDMAAFEKLMRRHNRRLFRAARSILRSDPEAEDVVQETYLAAFRALSGFRGDAKLSTWLTRIAVNEALQRVRRRRQEIDTVPADNVIDLEKHVQAQRGAESLEEGPERALARAQTRRLLERKIDELPAAYRTVFMLRAVEELPAQEVGELLGIPEATVRTRFFRARNLLRKALQSELDSARLEAFSFDGERCDRVVRSVIARVERELDAANRGH